MEILVTGAPGWLGSRLVEVLCRGADGIGGPFGGSRVRCLIGPGMEPSAAEKFGANAVMGNLADTRSLQKAVEGVQLLFHLAGIIHPRRRIAELFEINTEGTRNLLAASAQAGVKRFIYVSSNSVGGVNRTRDRLMSEDDPPRPYMAYGLSKYLAEQAVLDVYRKGLMETVIIRPCWFYGPGQPARQTRFFRMIATGRPIVFGTGENSRSMSYIDNTVQGLILGATEEAANGQIYWIADARPYKTIEIYETVARVLGVTEFRPRFLPDFASEMVTWFDRALQTAGIYQIEVHVAGEMNKNIACSIEKARKELRYSPKIDLEEGMRRSIQWCQANGIRISA